MPLRPEKRGRRKTRLSVDTVYNSLSPASKKSFDETAVSRKLAKIAAGKALNAIGMDSRSASHRAARAEVHRQVQRLADLNRIFAEDIKARYSPELNAEINEVESRLSRAITAVFGGKAYDSFKSHYKKYAETAGIGYLVFLEDHKEKR